MALRTSTISARATGVSTTTRASQRASQRAYLRVVRVRSSSEESTENKQPEVVRPHSTGPKASTFQGEHIAPHNKPGITRDGRDRCIVWQACGSVAAQHTLGILPANLRCPHFFLPHPA